MVAGGDIRAGTIIGIGGGAAGIRTVEAAAAVVTEGIGHIEGVDGIINCRKARRAGCAGSRSKHKRQQDWVAHCSHQLSNVQSKIIVSSDSQALP